MKNTSLVPSEKTFIDWAERNGLELSSDEAVLLLGYIALRFRKIGGLSAGVTAIVALLHDVLLVYFAFVLFGFPINDIFIAVVLTVLGYSLNDTIVIYDRIRENRSWLLQTIRQHCRVLLTRA